MNNSEKDQLLREILEPSDFRQASLECGLASIRQRRCRRRTVRACALASLLILMTLGILFKWASASSPRRHPASGPTMVTVPAPRVERAEIKFITDEELFALFPNRPLALIGKPGQQQLVFLDERISQQVQR